MTTVIIYKGWRDQGGAHVRLIEIEFVPGRNQQIGRENQRRRKLPARLDLFNHSPTGFEWGYEGSGPAQLALAILAHALGDDARAVRLHQTFKRRLIGRLPRAIGAEWEFTREHVLQLADQCEAERTALTTMESRR